MEEIDKILKIEMDNMELERKWYSGAKGFWRMLTFQSPPIKLWTIA